MNAAQLRNDPPVENAEGLSPSVALSALVDGELGASDVSRLLASPEDAVDTLANWHAYQLIGDALRGQADLTGVRSPPDFLASVRQGIQAGSSQPQVRVLPAEPRARDAANDAVFRWKMVAGFASLTAVMAVSWSVLVGSGVEPDGGNADGPRLASNVPAQAAVAAAEPAATAAAPLAVSTGQGIVIRDAQLEALLAEHRQNGGMSALQMPTGFIRNATYDASGR